MARILICEDEEIVRKELSRITEVPERENLIVLRTFSKLAGLAGLRVGYGVGSAELVGAMQRVRQPFNVGSLAQAAAVAALGDNEHIAASQRVAGQARRAYEDAFAGLGLDFVPSQANFVLVEVGDSGVVSYTGNYTKYLREKEKRRLQQEQAAVRQERQLASQQKFIDRFRAKATKATQVKSREKALAKVLAKVLAKEPDCPK